MRKAAERALAKRYTILTDRSKRRSLTLAERREINELELSLDALHEMASPLVGERS